MHFNQIEDPMRFLNRLPLLIFFLNLMLYVPLSHGNELEDLVIVKYYESLGDQFFASREIPGNLEKGLKIYHKAISLKQDNPSINWKIARVNWFLGRESLETKQKRIYFQQGIKYGKRAILADGNNALAQLWYGLSLGSHALEVGVMKALYQRDEIKDSLKKALELDRSQTRAILGLAGWYFSVPEVFGGSKETSFSMLDQAIKMDPNFTATYLLRGQYLMKIGKQTEAVGDFNKLLTIDNPTSSSGSVYDKAVARNLLAKLKS